MSILARGRGVLMKKEPTKMNEREGTIIARRGV